MLKVQYCPNDPPPNNLVTLIFGETTLPALVTARDEAVSDVESPVLPQPITMLDGFVSVNDDSLQKIQALIENAPEPVGSDDKRGLDNVELDDKTNDELG